jgi:hypothetical protein
MKTSINPILAGLLLAGFASSSQATVLYQDNFNRTGVLNGSAPSIDNTGAGAVWTGNTYYTNDGSSCISPQPGQADWNWPIISLPWDAFTYVDPKITCDVKLDSTTTGDWMGIGFGGTGSYWDNHLFMTLSGDGHVSAYYGATWGNTTITNNVLVGIPGGWNTISLQYSNSPILNADPGSVTVIVNGNYVVKEFPIPNTYWVDSGIQLMQFNNGSGKYDNFAVTFGDDACAGPSFATQPPSSTAVFQSAPLTLATRVNGTLPLSYQWYKNGVAVSGANSGNYSLSSAATSDTANYTLVVTNACGRATSTVAQVTVHLKNDKVLAQRNFDDIWGSGYNQSYPYNDHSDVVHIITTNSVVAGAGVDGSSGFVVGWDGTPYTLTNSSWAGIAGQAVFQSLAAPLTTAYLPALEVTIALRAENFTNGATTSFGVSLSFANADNSYSFGGAKSVNVSSNFQTFTLTMDTFDIWGGNASVSSFATNYSGCVNAAVTATAYGPWSDFVPDPNCTFVIDNVKVVQRTSPPLAVSNDGVHTYISWADPTLVLLSATSVSGPWTDVLGATSPYQAPAGSMMFYRTRW